MKTLDLKKTKDGAKEIWKTLFLKMFII